MESLPLWAGFVLWVAGVAAAWFFFAKRRSPGNLAWRVRGITLATISLGALLSGVRCAGPGKTVSWAVVWDASASMGEPDGTETRWAHARSAWKKIRSQALGIPHFLLSQSWGKADDSTLDSLTPSNSGCDGTVLQRELESNPFDGILLFSDGRWSEDGFSPGTPLFCVGVGDPSPIGEAVVESVQCPSLAFSGAPVSLSARVSAQGTTGPVTVSLFINGRRVNQCLVDPSAGSAVAAFQWVPDRDGLAQGEIRVEPSPSQTRRGNNARSFVVDVRRDRVRTLYISGRPGANYNFLRAQLKNDPAVELVSFVVLRDPEDALSYGDGDLSLIPFPSAEALAAQLPTFSAVILEEWTALRFALGPAFLSVLDRWVRAGGGVLFIEDPPTSLALSPWAEGTGTTGPQRFALVPKDVSHPLLFLGDGNRDRWNELGTLEGTGLFAQAVKPGSRILASEPGGRPVLAERNLDRGRILGMANRTSWRWAMEGGRRGEGPADYQRFWENVIRWLAATPGAGSVRMDRPSGPLSAGIPIPLSVQTPAGATVPPAVFVRSLKGKWSPISVRRAGPPGRYETVFTPPVPGPYEIRARVGQTDADRFWIDVSSGWDEQLDRRPDFVGLERRARLSGGEFVHAKNFNKRVWSRWNRTLKKNSAASVSTTLFLVPGLIALVLEWVWRRRRGLP